MKVIRKIIGNYSDRKLKNRTYIDSIELEPEMKKLSDKELKPTDEFKQRLAGGETLDDILPEVLVVRAW